VETEAQEHRSQYQLLVVLQLVDLALLGVMVVVHLEADLLVVLAEELAEALVVAMEQAVEQVTVTEHLDKLEELELQELLIQAVVEAEQAVVVLPIMDLEAEALEVLEAQERFWFMLDKKVQTCHN
jgi:hypothetical protein